MVDKAVRIGRDSRNWRLGHGFRIANPDRIRRQRLSTRRVSDAEEIEM